MFVKGLLSAIRLSAVTLVVIAGLATIIGTSGDSGDSTQTTTPDETVSIVTPQDGKTAVEGDYVSFISQLTDAQTDETYSYSWSSSIDGEIGTTANVTTDALSAGEHVVTLTVTDSGGNTVDTDQVTITIGESDDASDDNTSPNVTISSPTSGTSFSVGETVTFEGSAEDAEDGTLTGSSLVWSCDTETSITSTGTTTSGSFDEEGEHIVYLTATDSNGSSSTAFITVTIGDSSSLPDVQITSPSDGAEVAAGDTVSFTGSAADYNGSAITGTDLEWLSSKDGKIGTGTVLDIDTRSVAALDYEPLTEGEHTISLRAYGSQSTAQTSITITLTNTSPTATITNPPEECPESNTLCKTFATGEWINFEGSGTDSEDGSLSGDSLEWKSHIDGLIGTGEILDIKSDSVAALGNEPLTDGEHIITLEAKDDWGASGTDTVIINVGTNTSPVPTITYPTSDYTSETATGYVTFYGEATDAEDGQLTSDDLAWYRSDQQGKLTPEEPSGTGMLTTSVELDLSTFASGTHTITLVATDSMGSQGVTSRNLTVP